MACLVFEGLLHCLESDEGFFRELRAQSCYGRCSARQLQEEGPLPGFQHGVAEGWAQSIERHRVLASVRREMLLWALRRVSSLGNHVGRRGPLSAAGRWACAALSWSSFS